MLWPNWLECIGWITLALYSINDVLSEDARFGQQNRNKFSIANGIFMRTNLMYVTTYKSLPLKKLYQSRQAIMSWSPLCYWQLSDHFGQNGLHEWQTIDYYSKYFIRQEIILVIYVLLCIICWVLLMFILSPELALTVWSYPRSDKDLLYFCIIYCPYWYCDWK